MRATVTPFLFLLALCSFTNDPDPRALFESGMKNCLNKEYVKAISDFTMAISLKPDFGEAYLHRAKAKLSFAEKMGFANSEYCFDLVQALQLGQWEATGLLQQSCDQECFGLSRAFIEPDLVLCADFSSKMLSTLPRGSENLVNLVKLNLFNNKLSAISPQFGGLSALLVLDLSSNQLETLHPLMGNLKNLEELNLNKNRLTTLPEEMGNLTRIKRLYLRSNELVAVPPTIANCQELEQLDLSFNKLSNVPEELFQLKKLKTLNLTGNSIDKKLQKKISASLPNAQVFF